MNDSNRWIWTLIQGVLAVALGLWALLGRESALTALAYAGAIYVGLAGLIQTVRALLAWGSKSSTTELVRGLTGLIGGAIVLIMVYFVDAPTSTVNTLLAIVLIAYGAIGLFASLFARDGQPFEWQPVFVNALMILLGVLVFFDQSREFDLLAWTAVIFIAAGAVMIWYALARQRGNEEVATAA